MLFFSNWISWNQLCIIIVFYSLLYCYCYFIVIFTVHVIDRLADQCCCEHNGILKKSPISLSARCTLYEHCFYLINTLLNAPKAVGNAQALELHTAKTSPSSTANRIKMYTVHGLSFHGEKGALSVSVWEDLELRYRRRSAGAWRHERLWHNFDWLPWVSSTKLTSSLVPSTTVMLSQALSFVMCDVSLHLQDASIYWRFRSSPLIVWLSHDCCTRAKWSEVKWSEEQHWIFVRVAMTCQWRVVCLSWCALYLIVLHNTHMGHSVYFGHRVGGARLFASSDLLYGTVRCLRYSAVTSLLSPV